jgi:formate C-acetyltransferase
MVIEGSSFWWTRTQVPWYGTIFDQMILKPDDPEALPAMQRITRLREECIQRYHDGKWKLSMTLAKIITDSYQQNEGEHPAIRRALAIRDVFRQIPIPPSNDQLLTGSFSSGLGFTEFHPENMGYYARRAMNTPTQSSNEDQFEDEMRETMDLISSSATVIVNEEDHAIFKAIYPYWKTQSFGAMMAKEMQRNHPETWEYYENSDWSNPLLGGGLSHTIQDYLFIVEKGLDGFKDEIRQQISELDPAHPTSLDDFERRNLYEAMLICADGLIEYAHRCANQAEARSKTEQDPQRAQELTKIAEICRKVPEHPAETWWEALQSIHFLHLGTILAEGDLSNSFGNFDQYMYPILKKDLENGTITLKKAQELLECFYCKRCDTKTGGVGEGFVTNDRIDIGGQDEHGRDRTNLLSYMCLEAHAHVHLNEPVLSVRVHKTTSDKFLRMALEVVRLGGGSPYLIGDNAIITGLLAMGIPLAAARNYGDIGCQEIVLDPNVGPRVDSNSRTNTGFVNMVKPIELALWNGYNPMTGQQTGPQTGDPRTFKTFAEFKEAVNIQFEEAIRHNVIFNNVWEALHARIHPHVFHDLAHPGTRRTGIDINAGGCAYNWAGTLAVGTGNIGDNMTAIDYLIYETKQVTWDELLDALQHDWEGYETLRQQCINAPKYGTNDPYADAHTREILEQFFTIWESFHLPRSFNHTTKHGLYTSGLMSMSTHMRLGETTGATPDGRKAGEHLADSMAPSQYAPALGPTATHLSATQAIDTAHTVNGIIFNQKFSPISVLNEREVSRWMDLVRTYTDLGGQQVTYNIVDNQTLLDAQKHPEQYQDLWIRVGGYCAKFIDLSTELQDEIIARAELAP